MESEKVSSDLPYEYQLEDMSCFAEVIQETPPISSVKVELSKTWQNTSENSSDTTEQKEPETIGDENSSDKYGNLITFIYIYILNKSIHMFHLKRV